LFTLLNTSLNTFTIAYPVRLGMHLNTGWL